MRTTGRNHFPIHQAAPFPAAPCGTGPPAGANVPAPAKPENPGAAPLRPGFLA